MSNLCKTALCSTVQSTVSSVTSACDATDILFSTVSVDKIEPTNRISKVVVNDLPDANTVPNGQVAYLDDAKVPVIASNGTWIGFDGRVLGTCTATQLWGWGCNGSNYSGGPIGDGTVTTRCSPVRERCSATDWCQVSAGRYHTAAIKTTGQIWTWGGSNSGQLGDGTATNRCSPVREICSATDWCLVSAGSSHTVAIKTSGELWAWGNNFNTQLGDGTNTNRCSPVREICSATDWCSAGLGVLHTAAIKTSGELWTWGRNYCGQLGDGTTVSSCSPVREFCSATDWCQVSAGLCYTAAIKTTGQIWSWGTNACGNLADGTVTTRCSPVRERCSATNWCTVNTTYTHSVAIKTSGELWVWGRNFNSQLGDGTATNRCSPIREICSATDWCLASAGGFHTAAIKTTGQLWAWGGPGFAIGDGTTVGKCSPVREFCSATNWCSVSAGCARTAALNIITCVCR